MRRLTIVSFVALLGAAPVSSPRLVVPRDHAVRLPMGGVVSAVIVGDPAVADVIVVDPHTVLVQGRAYGRTEVIALDRAHQTVWQGEVAVVAAQDGHVSVQKGTKATDYSCAGSSNCAVAAAARAGGARPAPSAPPARSAVSGAPPVKPFSPGR
jgi:Flp pilus assembly secretin CpaC